MMQRFFLWLLLFHIGFFTLQMSLSVTQVNFLIWLAAASGVVLVIPWGHAFVAARANELAVLNLLLVLLQIIWLITGVNHSTLSFIALGLVGAAVPIWSRFEKNLTDHKLLNLPYISVVMAVAFVLLSQTIDIYCTNGLATDFDSQNYLTWAFTAYKNYLPYRDVVYWYGLFSYYAASLASLKVLTVVWSMLLCTAFAVVARRYIQHSGLLAYFLLLCFTIIQSVSGFGAFFRYGTSLALSIGSSYLLSRKLVPQWGLVLLGIVAASTVFFISDQGIYFSLIVAAQIFLRAVFIERESLKKTFSSLVQQYFWYGLGYSLVLVVAFTTMAQLGALQGYIENIQAMGMMGVFAKVALNRLLFSKENILTTVTLFLGTQLFVYQTFFAKPKQNRFTYLLNAAWLMALWLCQNKFLIRPWFEVQFVLFSFIFYSLQVVQISNSLAVRWLSPTAKNLLVFALITGFFSLLVPDKAVINLFNTTQHQYGKRYEELVRAPGFSAGVTACLNEYFGNFDQHLPQKHAAVLNWINAQPYGETATVFSFPGEPIFYVGRDQKPPVYFNAYDATSLAAQQKNIDYMAENNVRYVIWDTDNIFIQDDVPNILRNNLVVRYILKNYGAKQQVGSYLIFEKTAVAEAFLTNPLIQQNTGFYESLTYLNLKYYPVLLQQKMQNSQKTVLANGTHNGAISIPAQAETNSLYIWISATRNTPIDLELETTNDLKTKLSIAACTLNKPCLVPLRLLPLFYAPTKQVSVSISTTADWTAKLIHIPD